ncbi:MAG TPA: hypothetical protein VLB44_08335 [Kofleriaceae bacterium]|nr:hypothetical protein [Kofleriaceae bacterium]
MKGLLVVVVAVVSAACGGKTPAPTRPETGSASPQSGSATTAPVTAALGEQECEQLFAHVMKVSIADRPADQRIDEAEQAKAAGELRAQYFPECRAKSRATFDCVMAAQTTSGILGCEPQASRSSSTSNSNVAPGGMTPAAPRSP